MICQNFVRKFGSLRISSYLCGRRIIRIKGSCVWNSTYIAALYTVRSVSLRGTTTDNRIILFFFYIPNRLLWLYALFVSVLRTMLSNSRFL